MADRKKAPELSAGLVAVKGQAVPASDMQPRAASVVPEPVEAEPEVVEPPAPEELQGEPAETEANNQPLNFRVPQAFRREFRVYAASHDLKLHELLQLCFDAYKKRETKSTQASSMPLVQSVVIEILSQCGRHGVSRDSAAARRCDEVGQLRD